MKNTILSLCFGICALAISAQNFDDVVIKTNRITDNIYMLEGRGGNIGIFAGEDGVFMIDDQYATLSDKIKNAIAEISAHPVKFLVNTHWHGDHAGGNENFGNDGAIIIAHKNVFKRLSKDQFMQAFSREIPAAPEAAWPTISFEQDINIYLNGENIVVLHIHNAHTDGDSFVWFPTSNVIHMGDCFFKGRFPFIDLGSGGSVDGYLRAVETALMLTDSQTKIIPGHGEMADKTDLLKFYTAIMTMRDRVKQAIAEGKTIEAIKAAGLDEGFEEWGTGFISGERFIDTIWTDLTREE